MSEINNVTALSYRWLETAFGKIPTLTKEQLLDKAKLIKKLCIEEIDEFIKATEEDNYQEQLNACSDLLFVANNLPFLACISEHDLQEENIRVYYSNMTKFCVAEEEAIKTVEAYRNGSHPNKPEEKIEAVYMPTGNSYYPFRIQTPQGKILKSINFVDVR